MSKDLYADLGVPKGADAATVKRAYRRKAKATHPDKGGSKEAFLALQLAYDVLGDEGRRRRYDETGATADPASSGNRATRETAQLLVQLAQNIDPGHDDLVALAEKHTRKAIEKTAQEAALSRELSKRFQDIACRIKTKAGGENVGAAVMLDQAAKHAAAAAGADQQVEFLRACLALLGTMEYRTDPPAQPRPMTATQVAEAYFRRQW